MFVAFCGREQQRCRNDRIRKLPRQYIKSVRIRSQYIDRVYRVFFFFDENPLVFLPFVGVE